MKKVTMIVMAGVIFLGGFYTGILSKKKMGSYNRYHSVVVRNLSQNVIVNIKIAKWDFDLDSKEEELECPSTSTYKIFKVTIRDKKEK